MGVWQRDAGTQEEDERLPYQRAHLEDAGFCVGLSGRSA
jgi:hypothetical protein